MAILTREQRNQLSKVVLEAREIAKASARKVLHSLGVDEADAPGHLSPENRALRRALRAQARQLGDKEDPRKKGSYDLYHLTEKIAYDQWHRMLFARFLAENDLLIAPDHEVPVSLGECRELAPEIGLKDEWDVAVRFAARSLPQIFRPDDPAGKIELAPEDRASLRDLVIGLPRDTFLADDSLGWSYQFWQTERKEQVNESGNKIGADELPAVTQLFTEDYMVDFLLDNTLGAWHASKILASNSTLAENAQSEDELREAVALRGCPWKYLRFVKNQDGKWTPAAGTFDGWPRSADELKCLDPCMGSGHFVVAMFDRLVTLRMAAEKLEEREAVVAVIRDNLFGLEIDPRCTQIAAFNLAFAAWRRVGHCALPAMNLACSGLAPNAKLEDWLKIASDDQKLQRGMERLYRLFQKAPVLGSLINPRTHEGDLLVAEFHELQPLLEKALAQEAKDEIAHEMAVTAHGIAKAAEILADHFILVTTNVPYLGRGKQDATLQDHCESKYPEAKADLATCFVERCLGFCSASGSVALVTPQNWLFLSTYGKLRISMLRDNQWELIARLGPNAFQDMNWWAATTALTVISSNRSSADHRVCGLDVSSHKEQSKKAALLQGEGDSDRSGSVMVTLQRNLLSDPNARIIFRDVSAAEALSTFALSNTGLQTGDNDRYSFLFWELPRLLPTWEFFHRTSEDTRFYGGRIRILRWENGNGALVAEPGYRPNLAHESRGRSGVLVHRMNELHATLFSGEIFDQNGAAIIPNDENHLAALWCFLSSHH